MPWRTVKAKRDNKKITLEFFEEGWYTPKRRLHQVTIEEHRLIAELKRVGLFTEPDPDLLLANEISWYDTIKTLSGGTPDVKEQRNQLWRRITRKLNLE